MPYYYLALGLNELGILSSLVDKLLDESSPVPELRDGEFVAAEVQRIKKAALRDVLLFNSHFRHYIRVQLSAVYEQMIRIHEIRMALPDEVFCIGLSHYRFQQCNGLLKGFLELESFYSKLGKELQEKL
jgi:hypothetical protein